MTNTEPPTETASNIKLRTPTAADGPALHQLIKRCQPLDENSRYCNLLHCSHFADTSVAAFMGPDMVGFISGYRIPNQHDTYFLWQVAVDQRARGQGLARRMIQHILHAPAATGLRFLETTITPDNAASWALFRSFARDLGAELNSQLHFECQTHFDGAHDDEHLLRIGPFTTPS